MKTEGGGAVRHLQMSESEIVSSYRTARDPKRQIGILAELNAVTPRVIREVLEEAGELPMKPRSRGGGRPLGFDAGLARQMFEAGLTDEQISLETGIPLAYLDNGMATAAGACTSKRQASPAAERNSDRSGGCAGTKGGKYGADDKKRLRAGGEDRQGSDSGDPV